ncbi:AzlD domain-containing protein [Pseudonocardia sp. CA-107938]|uniref:AzlD domain-containing protein n=1 Tax=Pseudonocardia sp. CA-107938 TaxID=3240021 RepID=UPI003D900783
MTLWITIGLVAAITVAFKAIGPAVLGDRELPDPVPAVIALLAPALLAGLVITDIAGAGWAAVDWTLCGGLAVIVVAYLLRAPALVAILVGVGVTALLRFLV